MKGHYLLKILVVGFILTNATTRLYGQTENQKIAVFTKVWGFIKYHHPVVATGSIDWDSVFISHINNVRFAKSKAKFNSEIAIIINVAGDLKHGVPAKMPTAVFTVNHDLKWLNSSVLSKHNKESLWHIYKYRNQGGNRFLKNNNATDYSGEKQYEDMGHPTTAFRLLFLARFWNAINYFDPYKYLTGDDWNNTLIKFIPQVINANNIKNYYNTLFHLSKTLKDGHSSLTLNYRTDTLFNRFIGNMTMPFYCKVFNQKLLITKLVNDSLCKAAGVKNGDEVISVDDKPVKSLLQYRSNYISASNTVSLNTVLGWYALDDSLTSAKLKIKRNAKFITINAKRVPSKFKNWYNIVGYTGNGKGYEHINKSILLIYASEITEQNLDTLRRMIIKSKAVIFDVRNYPGQDAFYNIMGIMLPESKVINYSAFFMADNPGYFNWKPSHKIGDLNPGYYKGKTVILVDERSQSQGEYSAMVLQTIPGSFTIGSQTAGTDGAVSQIPMGGKLAISYSGYGIYYPDKTQTQQVGVRIDIPVKKTIQSIINNQDVIMEEALKYLKQNGVE
jgi:carboxyl-terminal processing protease